MNYTREYFVNLATELSEIASHSHVVSEMVKVREAPDHERISLATAVYPEELEKAGVDVPSTFRVAPRTFEKPDHAVSNGPQNLGVEPGSEEKRAWSSYGSMDVDAYDRSAWGAESEPLPDAPEDTDVIRNTVYGAVIKIADFVLDSAFNCVIGELYSLPEDDRPQFVLDVLLNSAELSERGVVVPERMSIQRSTFYDGRPTLFCIAQKENLAYPWRKITITFDNLSDVIKRNETARFDNVIPLSLQS
ncbi:hypothetical protein NBRC116583_03170 [Arenicella sp. 4NH20-0111]|uniref:hypothetical protein n=1 Tax=Arenicella sp. 4NH20-0111 TaxID=3127648 RepID=UPI003102613B